MSVQYSVLPEFSDYVKVVAFKDTSVGLQGYIAIHNTNLGPALGGTRIYNYKTKKDALEDALRLSKAMTYKCAIAGLPFGGGKGVIIADPHSGNKNKLLKSYAQIVRQLSGEFYTGEDVGLTEADVQYMLKFCPYFIGKSDQAGDPSPHAALSTFLCIKESLRCVFGNSSVKGRAFAVKGLGKTGSALIDLLLHEGAIIAAVSDIHPTRTAEFKRKYPNIKIVQPNKILGIEADVFCPCALGGDITKETINSLKVKIIAGTANNQISSPALSQQLYKKGIWHVPDYMANAGGLIDVANELLPGGFNKDKVLKSINKMPNTLKEVFEISRQQKKNPDLIAGMIAEKIFTKSESGLQKAIKIIQAVLEV